VEQLFYVNPETGVQFLRARCQYAVNQNELGLGMIQGTSEYFCLPSCVSR
jgi:hypothetical protein